MPMTTLGHSWRSSIPTPPATPAPNPPGHAMRPVSATEAADYAPEIVREAPPRSVSISWHFLGCGGAEDRPASRGSRGPPAGDEPRFSRCLADWLAERDEGVGAQVVGAPAVVGELCPGLDGQPGARRVDPAVEELVCEAELVRCQEHPPGRRDNAGAERDAGDSPPVARDRGAEAIGVDLKQPAARA